MTILYSWSATKCNRTIGTYWVDHSPKGRRMEFIIETGLYRPRVKFLVMYEVVQTIYTQNMPQTRWANFLGNLKRGWYLWTEWFSVTVRKRNRWRTDRPFSFRPSLYPHFLYISPFSPGLLNVLLSHAPLLLFPVHRLRSLPTSHRRVHLLFSMTE